MGRTALLIILDGFGVRSNTKFNAIAAAKTPVWDRLLAKYPHTTLDASASAVGLPSGFMGNSEVGHLNIGAGRVVHQDFSLIANAVETGAFFKNKALGTLMEEVRDRRGATLHLMGLISDGGVHSHLSHLGALLQMAKQKEVSQVWIHGFTDGRDTPPTSGLKYVEKIQQQCEEVGLGRLATLSGRFYAMDRDKRWERTEAAYQTLVSADGERFSDPVDYLRRSYDERVTDEFVVPACAKGYPGVKDGDGIVFFNFRADRARQITQSLTLNEFSHFRRDNFPTLSGFVCMTRYDDSFALPVAFEKPKVPLTLGEFVSRQGIGQLRIAETEKYAHVTYFLNGGEEKVFEGEDRILVPSPREVKTYDEKPEMSAEEVTRQLMEALESGKYGFVVLNFANCDMVGHTGNFQAAVQAVETVDQCLGKIIPWVERRGALAVITADHGNCERMQDDEGGPFTSHTLEPVPFVVVDPQGRDLHLKSGGKLSDVAPTLLKIWGFTPPSEMTGQVLIP